MNKCVKESNLRALEEDQYPTVNIFFEEAWGFKE